MAARGALGQAIAAACAGGRGRPPRRGGVGAEAPSSPSWGCTAGSREGTGTCEAAGAGGGGGGGASARRRGCARWARPSRARASGCCGWSIPTRCHCPSASLPRRRPHLRPWETSHLLPQHCQDLYCRGGARPRFLLNRCFGSLKAEERKTLKTFTSAPATRLQRPIKSM